MGFCTGLKEHRISAQQKALYVIGHFMRTLIFLVTIFIALTSSGQNTLDNRVSSDVCNCMNQTKNLTEDDFLNCFQIAMKKNAELIIKECQTLYNDTSYQTGYKFGQELYGRISVSMIF